MGQKNICTICKFCGKQCHMLADTDETGRVVRIHPDPAYKTIWCETGKNVLELMNHPERIRMPLKRLGKKGENRWEEISWEEAFAETGERFAKIVREYGPNSFLGIRGFNKPYFNAIYERLMNTIGTVNSMGAANMCHMPSMSAAKETFGFMPDQRITEKTKSIILWGSNPYCTDKRRAAKIQEAVSRGAKLVVIDPCRTYHARRADIWLPIRPGTDMALALGMIHTVIEEKWYDEAFIRKCTFGFEEVRESAAEYTLKRTAEICGLSEGDIRRTAELFALSGPGIIEVGNAMDHNEDSFQKCRAINIFTAITGNVDKDGALTSRGPMPERQLKQRKRIAKPEICPFRDPDKRRQIIGFQEGWLDNFNESWGKALSDTLNSGKPYPIKAVYVQGGNPAMIWENREELVKAFCNTEFMVVSDFFMTPTAMLADLILPPAVYLEYESITADGSDTLYYSPKVAWDASAKSDLEIINEIGKAMGYQESFWDSMEDYWNEWLKPYELSLAQVREAGKLVMEGERLGTEYGKYRQNGFPTASGKIQLYSENMAAKGNPPVPVFHRFNEEQKGYPYLATNYKSEYFYHTAGRQIEEQRKKEPEAIAIVSGDIAREQRISEGDYILVRTQAGCVCQKAHIEEDMAAGVVALSHGWWYPEKEKSPFVLQACTNNIAYDDRWIGRELPSFTTRGIPCSVTKWENPRFYEDIYPEGSMKPYDIRIMARQAEAYLRITGELKEKGLLEGNPRFVLEAPDEEAEKIVSHLSRQDNLHGIAFRVHDFCEETFKRIEKICEENRNVRFEIEYVMCQQNMKGRYQAEKWAKAHDIDMHVKYVSLETAKRKLDYLSGQMSTHDIIIESKKYFFHFLDQLEEERQKLYHQYGGKERVLVNEEAKLLSEWDFGEKPWMLPLSDITDYHEWREWNKKIFLEAVKNPFAGILWLWGNKS